MALSDGATQMSSAGKAHTPATFTFNQRVVGVAGILATVSLVITIVHLYVPPTPEQQAASQKQMIEMVCRGETQGPPAYSEELCGKLVR
jgi:hypothetical protein